MRRETFVAEYVALTAAARRTGVKIFFADEAYFRADGDLRGKWVLKEEPALVASTSPRWGEKASYYSVVCLETGEVEVMELAANTTPHLGRLPAATEGSTHRTTDRDLGQSASPSWRRATSLPDHA